MTDLEMVSINSNREGEGEKGSLLGEHEESKGSGSKFIYVITAFAAVGGFLFGYDTGVISGAILFMQQDFNLTEVEEELVISMALVGAIVGSFIGGPAADKWGRRPVIIVASILFAIGSFVLGFALNMPMLIVGRFIVGTGIGVAANIVPVYVAEIAPTSHRGSLVTIINLCITTGQFISYLVDSAFVNVPNGWRFMLGLAATPAIIQLIGMIFIVPESPRWMMSAGKTEEAIATLRKIRGEGVNIEAEIQEIQESISTESGSWKDLFGKSIRPALAIGVALQVFQQLCGINTAMYYSPTILKMAGFKDNATAIWFSDSVALTNALCTLIAVWLIDRVGRRKLLLSSMVGMILGLVLLGFAFFLEGKIAIHTGFMAVGSLVVYVAFFAIGMGPIPWTVNAEIYPQNVRGLANGVATTVNWSSNLLVSVTFLSYINLVGSAGAFWTYAGLGVVAWILFFFVLPETRGKSIEEIQADFRRKVK